jgi:hypothetical protein
MVNDVKHITLLKNVYMWCITIEQQSENTVYYLSPWKDLEIHVRNVLNLKVLEKFGTISFEPDNINCH